MSGSIKSLAMSVLQRHGAALAESQPLASGETTPRPVETAPVGFVAGRADPLPPGTGLPARRCRACNGWLYWVSVYGPVICAQCHPPASRALVKTWYWLPEGECKKTQ